MLLVEKCKPEAKSVCSLLIWFLGSQTTQVDFLLGLLLFLQTEWRVVRRWWCWMLVSGATTVNVTSRNSFRLFKVSKGTSRWVDIICVVLPWRFHKFVFNTLKMAFCSPNPFLNGWVVGDEKAKALFTCNYCICICIECQGWSLCQQVMVFTLQWTACAFSRNIR